MIARAWRAAARQFGRPSGLAGRLAGWIMARRPSNRERNRRTVELLGIGPEDSVLEIGFGPGVALEDVARRATRGRIVGIDHSPLMVAMASRRNAAAIADGRMTLRVAPAEPLPDLGGGFDKALAVNVAMFWSEPVATLRRIRAQLRPGGTLALTFQPRQRGATDEDARRRAETLAATMRDAGYAGVRVEMLPMAPVAAACVIGTAPPPGT